MFQTTLVMTLSGASADWSLMLPMASTPFSLAAWMTPSRSAYSTSAPAPIWARAASWAVAGSSKLLMKLTLTVTAGFTDWAPAMYALMSRLTSGMGMAPTTPMMFDLVRPPASMPAR